MAKKQLAHLFDATKCIGCQACIVSCVETNYPEMVGRHIEGKLSLIHISEPTRRS